MRPPAPARSPGGFPLIPAPRRRRLLAACVLAAALAGAGLAYGPLRPLARRLLAAPALRARAASGREPPFFSLLAASQVGYAPALRKAFTSPRPFTAFQVIDVATGAVALRGGGPERAVETDVLGPLPTAWIGDFTALRTPGRYRIVTDGGQASAPFDVRPDVYDEALRAAQRVFYFQRAFTAVEPAHAEGPWWHGDDRALAPPGVRAGWHDAGDLSIYTATTTIALFWLLQTYADLRPEDDDTNLPESGNGVPDLLDEARWGLTWLLSVQTAVGAFRNSTCQERYGPYGTNAPTAVPPYVAGEVGTLPTGRAVGTLAFAAHVFRPGDPAFAARLLEAARRGYAYLAARPGERSDGVTCGAYGTAGSAEVDSGVRAYAAAGMLLATGEPSYADDFARTRRAVRPESSYQNLTAFAALLYLRAGAGRPATRAALAAELDAVADRLLDQAARHPFEFPIGYPWGSLGAAFTATGSFNARRCLADPDGHARDCEAVLAAVHYALGRNGLGLCYVSGLRGVTAGRTSGFHQWLAALRADPHDFPGMVAGGPNARPEARDRSAPRARPLPIWGYFDDPRHPRSEATPLDGRFTDNDSWSTNEVAIDWQSASVYALHLARWAAHRGGAGGPGAQEPVEPTTGSASSGKGMPKSGLAPSPSTQR